MAVNTKAPYAPPWGEARVLYRVTVPPREQSWIDDTPAEFVVVESTIEAKGGPACVVWGRYRCGWLDGAGARASWLIKHLVDRIAAITEAIPPSQPEPPQSLLDAVCEMRHAQREYFRVHSPTALRAALTAETNVDRLVRDLSTPSLFSK
jgi:hypothetical protein